MELTAADDLLEGVDHGIAGDVNGLGGDAFVQQVGARLGRRRKVVSGK